MEKYYLYNLYKNLNLYYKYNNKININSISKHILTGGADSYYTTVFLQLFLKIKNELQNQSSKMNVNEIAIKMRTYSVLLEVYESYLNQLINDQEDTKKKIIKATQLAENSNFAQIEGNINDINGLFVTLLGTPSSGNLPTVPAPAP
jgi:hypothetical protein